MENLMRVGFQSAMGDVRETSAPPVQGPRTSLVSGQEECIFLMEAEFLMEEYFVLEYSCLGVRRPPSQRKPFVFAVGGEGEEALICYDDIWTDRRRHRIAVKTKRGRYRGIRIEFSADRRSKAEFVIYTMYTCCAGELPVCCEALHTETAKNFVPLDLSAQYSARYQMEDCMIDGGNFFKDEQVSLFEIPFRVKPEGNNLIAPPPPPQENDEIVSNFGARAKRRLCRPISRDSLTEIPIHQNVSEIFLLIFLSGKRHARCGFSTDGTILGTYCGDVTMPLLANDPEQFAVEIVYADGKRDWAVPLNLGTKRHGISGDAGVYAVPADGGYVEKIVLHNRMLDSDCSVAAATVNPSGERLLPDMLIPELPDKPFRKSEDRREVSLRGSRLALQNSALRMEIDISEGMRLLALKSAFTPQLKAKSSSMLQLRQEDGSLITRFELLRAEAGQESAELAYRCGGLELLVSARLSGEHGILWNLKTKNVGDEPQRAGILFPCISGVEYADAEDSWYFFPKYQNIDSNESVFIYEESAPSFPMQFFDVYSPSQQGGLSLTTQERGLTVRKYALEKDENGISFFVEYPSMYGEVLPGEERAGSPTLLTAHTGGWQKSFAIYKNWLDSWYEPYCCQNKQWYRECFWLIAEITDFFETMEFTKLPVWYDREKQECNFLKILEEQKEITGCYPDILHLWSWAYRVKDGVYSQQWGNFGSSDYDEYGGVEQFRRALHEVTEKTGTAVSLYLHPTLLSGRYPQSEQYFPKYRVVNEKGEYISIEGDSYRMCHANETWREYAVGMYPRICRELSVPILYVDEFSLRIENRCYDAHHGHPVPSNLLQTDREFIAELKDAVPEEVVLYGEYAAVDVNARYIDCNITYYIIDSVTNLVESAWRGDDGDDRLGRVFTNAYRFAFPKIVQLVLPMAMRNMSWHPQKFIFFNGEAVYDSFWDCEESAGLDFAVKAYRIKKKYADCFSSDEPQTMIETLSPAICANCFPGSGRVLYTLYNRAYSTYRGKVLRVPHEDGAQYYDVWNDEVIVPEIRDGYAEIAMEVHALEVTCIAVGEINNIRY